MRWPPPCRSARERADERLMADVKSRGPGAPTLALSLRVMIPKATVANKPGTPRRARYKRENHRAGNAGMSRLNLWYLPPAFFSAGGPWVRPAPGIPRALCMLARDELIASLGRDRVAR